MQLELPFFLISVVDSNIIYSHVPFIFSVIYIYIYIYSNLCLFCSFRIVVDIQTQDLHSLPISLKEPKYSLPISTAVNFCIFPPLLSPAGCSFLLDAPSVFWS